jgi:hypothetical protein
MVLAVSRILGTSLSGVGPVFSTFKRFTDDVFIDGITVNMNIKTLILPIQCEKRL